jgi:hypothetical protein
MRDEEFDAHVFHLISMVDNLDTATIACDCGQKFRLGAADDLGYVIAQLRWRIFERLDDAMLIDKNSRFRLIEAIEDGPPRDGAEYSELVIGALRLVDGIDGGQTSCACTRPHVTRITPALALAAAVLHDEALVRAGISEEAYVPNTLNFALVEAD